MAGQDACPDRRREQQPGLRACGPSDVAEGGSSESRLNNCSPTSLLPLLPGLRQRPVLGYGLKTVDQKVARRDRVVDRGQESLGALPGGEISEVVPARPLPIATVLVVGQPCLQAGPEDRDRCGIDDVCAVAERYLGM